MRLYARADNHRSAATVRASFLGYDSSAHKAAAIIPGRRFIWHAWAATCTPTTTGLYRHTGWEAMSGYFWQKNRPYRSIESSAKSTQTLPPQGFSRPGESCVCMRGRTTIARPRRSGQVFWGTIPAPTRRPLSYQAGGSFGMRGRRHAHPLPQDCTVTPAGRRSRRCRDRSPTC